MTPASIFQIHLALGYVPWLLVCGAYFWPWLWSVDRTMDLEEPLRNVR